MKNGQPDGSRSGKNEKRAAIGRPLHCLLTYGIVLKNSGGSSLPS